VQTPHCWRLWKNGLAVSEAPSVQRKLFLGELHLAFFLGRIGSVFWIRGSGVLLFGRQTAATDAAVVPVSTAFWSSAVPFPKPSSLCTAPSAWGAIRRPRGLLVMGVPVTNLPFFCRSIEGYKRARAMNRTFKAAVAALMVAVSFAGSVAAGPFEAAVAAYEKGVAAYEKGVAAYDKGVYATALRLLRPLAEQGEANAQYNLGLMFDNGQGVPQDYATAVIWYRKAAEQGHAAAQYNLGLIFANGGRGAPQDYATAASWYRKAAERGNAAAQYNLGVMYAQGQGVSKDYAAAANWYRKAAEQGNAMAQYNLGVMYDDGRGVPQDYAVATSWYRRAAEQGDADAQVNLGILYGMGQGVAQDYVNAHMWFSLAASGGDKNGVKARDMVAAKMTPAQLAEAQKLAREWKPTSTPARR
jgi:uncharacterized protein